jgi:hypothetical protein
MITAEQLKDLETLQDQLTLPRWSTKVGITTMNELSELGMVELKETKGGREFWYLTELGDEAIRNKGKIS